jgi:hypothetical protein
MVMLALAVVGCTRRAAPAFFLAPTESPYSNVSGAPAAAVGSPTAPGRVAPGPTVTAATPTPECTSGLLYVQDLTIPDGSNFAPGQPIDKEWQVRNSGTCNWDSLYGLKLISGDAMGAKPLLPLFPARAGTAAVLEIHFTAPPAGGLYECHWQAVDPQGRTFGDAIYMQVSVAP